MCVLLSPRSRETLRTWPCLPSHSLLRPILEGSKEHPQSLSLREQWTEGVREDTLDCGLMGKSKLLVK